MIMMVVTGTHMIVMVSDMQSITLYNYYLTVPPGHTPAKPRLQILPLPPLYTEAQNNSSNHALTAELKDCRTIKSINYCEDTCCVTQMQSAWPLVYCPYCCSFRYTMCVLEQLGGKGRYTCGHMDCMHQHYH